MQLTWHQKGQLFARDVTIPSHSELSSIIWQAKMAYGLDATFAMGVTIIILTSQPQYDAQLVSQFLPFFHTKINNKLTCSLNEEAQSTRTTQSPCSEMKCLRQRKMRAKCRSRLLKPREVVRVRNSFSIRAHWPDLFESEGSHRVVAIGHTVTNHEVFCTVPAPPTAVTIHAAPSTHVLRLPATTNPFASLPIPQLKSTPVNPRYHEAHQYYNEMRQYYASKAYTSMATAELIIVKVQMVTLEPGKRNPTLISVSNVFFFITVYLAVWQPEFQNLYEAINNIPVHIGVLSLKHILYYVLLPQFLHWSKDSHFQLRNVSFMIKTGSN